MDLNVHFSSVCVLIDVSFDGDINVSSDSAAVPCRCTVVDSGLLKQLVKFMSLLQNCIQQANSHTNPNLQVSKFTGIHVYDITLHCILSTTSSFLEVVFGA
jgi:hypothetical protein